MERHGATGRPYFNRVPFGMPCSNGDFMKSRRGFIKMVAGAMPVAAVATVVSQKALSSTSQPKSADDKFNEWANKPETQELLDKAFDMDRLAQHNGPLGGAFRQSDPFYDTFDCVRKRPPRNAFYKNPEYGDWFYHDAKDRCYVFDGHGWVWLLNPPDANVSNGPFQSENGKIEWIIEDGRVWITKIPWEYARKYLKGHLEGLKWHGMEGRKQWSCDLTHANTVYLRHRIDERVA